MQKSEEQKLIYSGQLLTDQTVLKDILRQYDGQDTHTVHLVFTPKNRQLDTNRPKEANVNKATIQSTPTIASGSSVSTSASSATSTMNTSANTDGLR